VAKVAILVSADCRWPGSVPMRKGALGIVVGVAFYPGAGETGDACLGAGYFGGGVVLCDRGYTA
jgi:hypothetical protein